MYSQNMNVTQNMNMNYQYGYHPEHPPAPVPPVDPNAPETFKANLQLVLDHVGTLRAHAKRGLAGIQNAYQVGSNPSETQQHIAAATEALAIIAELMQQSGIGALPMLEADSSGNIKTPTEAQLMETATKGVKSNFEKLKRAQESAAVIANLLSSDHRSQKP